MNEHIPRSEIAKLEARLRSFSDKIHNHIIRGGVKVAAKIIMDALKLEVPTDTGRLKESITYKIKKIPGAHEYKARVGAPKSEAFKLKFLESGTSAHLIKQPNLNREVQHPGSTKHKGIVTKAFLATSKRAAQSAQDFIANAIKMIP